LSKVNILFLSESISAVKEQISELLGNQNTYVDRLRQINAAIRATLTVHHQLISDVRSVLKTMAKVSSILVVKCKCSIIYFVFILYFSVKMRMAP